LVELQELHMAGVGRFFLAHTCHTRGNCIYRIQRLGTEYSVNEVIIADKLIKMIS